MSADLELRLPIIKTSTSQSSGTITNQDNDQTSCTSEEDCHTPKSPENMIPAVLICPPAPRKPMRRRRHAAACKRKLCELEFFEVVGRDEIESFFKGAEADINGGGAAKRSRCVM